MIVDLDYTLGFVAAGVVGGRERAGVVRVEVVVIRTYCLGAGISTAGCVLFVIEIPGGFVGVICSDVRVPYTYQSMTVITY